MGSEKYRKKLSARPSSFHRERGIKPPARGILIATEGIVTEPAYFEALKKKLALSTVEVCIEGAGIGDPQRLAEAALEERTKRRKAFKNGETGYSQVPDFDEIWIVFDTDVPEEHGKLNNGLQFAASKKVNCAHSTPCFEYWLLLHLEGGRTTSPMAKCKNVVPKLAAALKTKYTKHGEETKVLMPPLVEQTELARAVANAAWVRNYHRAGNSTFPCNPSTEVDRLIAAIRAAAAPAQKADG